MTRCGMQAAWLAAALLGACQTGTAVTSTTPTQGAGPTDASAARPAACPACECRCDCKEGAGDVHGLVRGVSRKIAHRDETCLADLNRVRELDPELDADLGVVRGQCEMIAGHCEAGKARILKIMRDDHGQGPDVSKRSADAMAGMYCRSGDTSDRDRLRGALHDLNDGAYLNRRDAAFCQARIDVVRKLLPRVRPADADDTVIKHAEDAAYVTAAKCLERAGDCKRARAIFETLYPRKHLAKVPAAQRPAVIKGAFDAIIDECKATP